ncbi:MAG: NUMOD3 domain-containing DNA-binding protein [Pseudomonadota bacterium]
MANAILNSCGIYSIRNIQNGKRYVGSAVNIGSRWRHHKSTLRSGRHHSIKLQRAWDLYKEDAFVFELIEVVADKCDLLAREQFWMDLHAASTSEHGYNVLPLARSSLGAKRGPFSDAHRAALSAARTGVKKGPMSPENRAKLIASHAGRPLSAEHKAKLSMVRKGKNHNKPITAEQRARLSETGKGRKHTEEARAKMSAATLGIALSEAHRAKISQSLLGMKLSPEHRAKLSAAKIGVKRGPMSEEHKAKISASRRHWAADQRKPAT